MSPSSNQSTKFNWQTLLVGVGGVVVVSLTILAAIFLAGGELGLSPAPALTETMLPPTSIIITPSATATAATPTSTAQKPTLTLPAATSSPTPTPTATATPSPTAKPTTPTPTPCAPREDWLLYVVQPGDTLVSLAARTNTTVPQLLQGNCLIEPTIIVGQQLRLPFIPPTLTPTRIPSPTPFPTPVPPTPTYTLTFTPRPRPPDVTLGTPTPTTTSSLPVELPPSPP